jgi:TonB family protein
MNAKNLFRCLTGAILLTAIALPGWAKTREVVPLRIIQTVEARFPVAADTLTLASGEARVLIFVDADGKLVDSLIVSHTQKSFATEALWALQQWRYEPARLDGQPVASRMLVTFTFEADRKVISSTPIEMWDNFVQSTTGAPVTRQVCQAEELDQALQALKTVRPRHPKTAAPPGTENGRVVLDFFVDETGRPRMPVVASATDDRMAAAAIDALGEWRFSTPLRLGRPVAVHVRQEFVFVN